MKLQILLIVLMLLIATNVALAEEIIVPVHSTVNVSISNGTVLITTASSSLTIGSITNTTNSFNTMDIDLTARTSILNGTDVREVLDACMNNLSESEFGRGVQQATMADIQIRKVDCEDNLTYYKGLYSLTSSDLSNKSSDLLTCNSLRSTYQAESTTCATERDAFSTQRWYFGVGAAALVWLFFYVRSVSRRPKGPEQHFPDANVNPRPVLPEGIIKNLVDQGKKMVDKSKKVQEDFFNLESHGAKPPI